MQLAGGVSGVFTFTVFHAGLVAAPSPGSIFALLAMTPKGGYVGTLTGVIVATAVVRKKFSVIHKGRLFNITCK